MKDTLKRLKNDYGVFEIKAEFEAEGTTIEELIRLKDITSNVGLPIILKIGGVEAVTDLNIALNIGVKGIIAPMVETDFALTKYLRMIRNIENIEFAFNVETYTALNNFEYMLELENIELLYGITVGRVDLSDSIGMSRDKVNTSNEIFNYCIKIFSLAKNKNLKTGMGGCISKEALDHIKLLKSTELLDKFETRKVVFPIESYKYGEKAIIEANKFELLWLKNKQNYHSKIINEDLSRIKMLEERIK